MADSFDIVIAGGGVMGSSTAFHLAADADFSGTIAVIEPDPTYEHAASALSVGAIRQQYSTPANIALSRWSLDFLRQAGEILQVDGERLEVGLKESGYLFLAGEAGMPVLRANHDIQKAHGVDVALLDPDELAARFAWMNTDGVAGGSLGLSGEGWFDGWSLLQALRRKAASLGVTYLKGEVTGMTRQGDRVGAVQWSGGPAISCGALVIAAGPWSGRLGKTLGFAVPVWPRKRFVHVVDCREPVPGLPMLIDTTGVYVRPEGARYICGVSPPAEGDGDAWDFEVEYDLFEEVIWPALARRVPAFAALKLERAWAGLYDYNTFDQNAILGPHTEIANLYFATGFSGHGIQQSPAAGRITAEWIIHGAPQSLDVSALAYERIPAGRAVREVNVI